MPPLPTTIVSGHGRPPPCERYRLYTRQLLPLLVGRSPPVRPLSMGWRMVVAYARLLHARGRLSTMVLSQPACYSCLAAVRIYWLCTVVAMQWLSLLTMNR
ncbi:hypothetical protein GW17_00037687 [Ensete ventricosum]|nr:hypothetical protein GW17_00037687 [Ensete ventricosum]